MNKARSERIKKLTLDLVGGTLDKVLCAFILGSTATAMDMETHLYFTFWGLNMLVKGALEKAGLPATYKHMEEQLKKKLKEMKYPTPYEMLKRMKASGLLKIYACTPTMEMFDVKNLIRRNVFIIKILYQMSYEAPKLPSLVAEIGWSQLEDY